MEFRVKVRGKGGSKVIADNVDLETAYQIVAMWGKGTTKHFAIEEIDHKLYSNLTAREALLRLEKGEF